VTLSIPKGERNWEYKAYLKEVFENVYSTYRESRQSFFQKARDQKSDVESIKHLRSKQE
jgi:hypothetical protein